MQPNPADPRSKRLYLDNVCQRFPAMDRRGLVTVLADIHLELDPGEFVAIVGPSGCGKSTLLNGVGGFVPFCEGTALIDGEPVGPPNKDRGIVFQDYLIPEFLTAVENVALGLELTGMHLYHHLVPFLRWKMREKYLPSAMEYLEKVGLKEHAHKYPRQLSGGQRQRVAIAQALAMKPKILLMDEPFSGLDPQTRELLQLLTLEIHNELHNTILFITHDLEEAVFLGTRIVVLSQYGRAGQGEGARI
ncbi:MAG: ABC transporter ATP-binding protein, partial [Verrucomicrobia bacterium]|nr:ABC transporter ATP-binding protein [Verrucomicrobiota bacterium]